MADEGEERKTRRAWVIYPHDSRFIGIRIGADIVTAERDRTVAGKARGPEARSGPVLPINTKDALRRNFDASLHCGFTPTTASSMDDLEALSTVLTKLSEEPYDLPTHIQHLNLAATAGEEQANEAREMFAAYWAAGDEVWIPLIDAKKRSSNIDSVSGAQEVHELYDKAEGDYLCTFTV